MRCRSDSDFPERPGGEVFVIFHGVVDSIMLLLTISCNSIIIYAILRHCRKLRLAGSTPCQNQAAVRLVLSLCTADIFVALSSIYFLLFEYSCSVFTTLGAQQTACLARFTPFMMTAATSCFSVCALGVDRYIAVVHAMRYREIMTKRVTNVIIFFIWFFGILVGSILIFWNNWSPTTPCDEFRIVPANFISVICVTVVVTVFLVLAFLHWRVHCVALAANYRKQSMGSLRHSHSESTMHGMTSKSARAIYLIVGCMIVLWTPITGVVIARSRGASSPYLDLAHGITFTLYNLSYIANSFIYAWKNTTIKLAILEVFGLKQRSDSLVCTRNSSVVQSVCSVVVMAKETTLDVIKV